MSRSSSLPSAELTVGQVASRSGIAVSALHFYEAEGLIHSTRTSGNQRRFPREVLRRVAFIRASQAVGIPLRRIRDALERLPDSRTPTRGTGSGSPRRGATTSISGSSACSISGIASAAASGADVSPWACASS